MLELVRQREFVDQARRRRRMDLPTSSGVLGLALGYDWLRDELPEDVRRQVREALSSCFGRLYDADGKPQDFPDNNWRQVIRGAHAVAAPAVADEHPEQAARVIRDAIPQSAGVAAHWRPDGVCPEGTHYWDFGAEFHVLMIDALRTAVGDDFGLGDWPVLDAGARWRIAARGPQGDFPFGDGDRANRSCIPLSWLAGRTGRDWLVRSADLKFLATDAEQKWQQEKNWMVCPLVWLPAAAIDGVPPRELLTFAGRGDLESASRTEHRLHAPESDHAGIVNVLYRSAWDERALWLGLAGGRANVSHGHMHAGSLVPDTGGVRWVVEPATHHDFNDAFENARITLWTWDENLSDGERRAGRRGREAV